MVAASYEIAGALLRFSEVWSYLTPKLTIGTLTQAHHVDTFRVTHYPSALIYQQLAHKRLGNGLFGPGLVMPKIC